MSGYSVTMKLEIKALQDGLKALKKEAKKAIRRGITKAGRVMVRSIKSHVPTETKLLKKSLGVVVRTYQSGTVVAIAGVRKGFRQQVSLKKVFRQVGKGGRVVRLSKPQSGQLQMIRNPEKYLHLVELGFTQTGGKHVPGKAPIRKGHAAVIGEMERIVAEEFKAGVET
jgi:hypothetical protein